MLTSTLTVENMVSAKTGKPVANQFVITNMNAYGTMSVCFQSYKSSIIELDYEHHAIYVFEDWDYSVTTAKYRNAFLRDYGLDDLASKAGLLDAIRRGKYDQPLSGGAMRDWEVITAF